MAALAAIGFVTVERAALALAAGAEEAAAAAFALVVAVEAVAPLANVDPISAIFGPQLSPVTS